MSEGLPERNDYSMNAAQESGISSLSGIRKRIQVGFLIASMFLGVPSSEDGGHCEQPTNAEIQDIQTLVQQAETEQDQNITFEERKEIADKYGLTIFEYESRYQDLFADLTYGDVIGRIPAEEYIGSAREFLNLYGVELEFGESGLFGVSGYLNPGKPLSKEQMDSLELKRSMKALIKTFGDQPRELIEHIGIKKVILVDSNRFQGAAQPFFKTRYFVDPSSPDMHDTPMHEFYHLIDYKCGLLGAISDTGFRALSPSGFYRDRGKYISYDESFDPYIQRKFAIESVSGDGEELDSFMKEYEKAQANVATFNNYGSSSAVEDKATIGSEILQPSSHAIFRDGNYPVLNRKFYFLLARLYKEQPAITSYLIELGGKSQVPFSSN